MEKEEAVVQLLGAMLFVVVEEAAALPGASSSQIQVARGTQHARRHIRGSNHVVYDVYVLDWTPSIDLASSSRECVNTPRNTRGQLVCLVNAAFFRRTSPSNAILKT
jgi:hypothetical protein